MKIEVCGTERACLNIYLYFYISIAETQRDIRTSEKHFPLTFTLFGAFERVYFGLIEFLIRTLTQETPRSQFSASLMAE